MKRNKHRFYGFLLSLILLILFVSTGCEMENPTSLPNGETPQIVESGTEAPEITTPGIDEVQMDKKGYYTSKEDVSRYLHLYGELPQNFITKNKARDLGWDASKGNLFKVTDRMSIGGDQFQNREGTLPNKKGRKWFEVDIDYNGGSRGAKRIVYSNDGLIYYTGDHYNTFEKLYGEE